MATVAVILTGPPGVGKTSVLGRLTTLLERDEVEFGALESEQLGWGWPWLAAEVVYRQLAVTLELQRQAGRRRFLIAATSKTSSELAALVAATGADRVVTVLLTAPAEVVASRIDAREPNDWPGKPRLIHHARQLAKTVTGLAGIDIRVRTDDRSPTDTAVDLRDALKSCGFLE